MESKKLEKRPAIKKPASRDVLSGSKKSDAKQTHVNRDQEARIRHPRAAKGL